MTQMADCLGGATAGNPNQPAGNRLVCGKCEATEAEWSRKFKGEQAAHAATKADLSRATDLVAVLEHERGALRHELGQVKGALGGSADALRRAKDDRKSALVVADMMADHIKPLRAEIAELHRTLNGARATEEQLRRQVSEERTKVVQLEGRLAAALGSCEMMQRARTTAYQAKAEAEDAFEKMRKHIDGLEHGLKDAHSALDSARALCEHHRSFLRTLHAPAIKANPGLAKQIETELDTPEHKALEFFSQRKAVSKS